MTNLPHVFAPLLLTLALLAGCNESCPEAKEYMCDRIQSMSCQVTYMVNSRSKVESACGEDDAERYYAFVIGACMQAEQRNGAIDCVGIADRQPKPDGGPDGPGVLEAGPSDAEAGIGEGGAADGAGDAGPVDATAGDAGDAMPSDL